MPRGRKKRTLKKDEKQPEEGERLEEDEGKKKIGQEGDDTTENGLQPSEVEIDSKTVGAMVNKAAEKGGEEDDEEDDEVFEVEKILCRHHYYKRHYYYYVKWKGYDETENTWEPRENLDGCPLLMEEFDRMLEKLEKEDEKEFRRQSANASKLWRKFGGKAAIVGGKGEEEEEEKSGETTEQQPGSSKDNVAAASASISSTPNPRKRKSEDDDDDDDLPRDSPAKKPKLTTHSFMKNWLEKGSISIKSEHFSPKTPTSPNAASPAKSLSSPVLNKIEAFNKLFKAPSSTKKSASEMSVRSSSSSSQNNDDDNNKQHQKALKRWENEMNSISKDPAKIVVENNVDLDGPPSKFTYINDYLPFDDIIFPDDPLIGCECKECDVKGCCPDNNDAPMAYNKYKRLRNYVSSKEPVWECNRLCKCGPDCRNRVVQKGRQVNLCIFKTENGRGWGVKTRQNIKAGTYVTTYLGELINHDEAEKRGKEYDVIGNTYLFDLDYADSDTCYTVDAAHYGNVSHFINHSCDPNLEIHNVFINNIDVSMPYLALFSCRDIIKGEELSFDYLMSGATDDEPLDVSSLDNASIAESRYDADRSGEDSEIFISAFDTFVEENTPTPNDKESVLKSSPVRLQFGDDDVFSSTGKVDKENVTPNALLKTPAAAPSKDNVKAASSSSSLTTNSPPRQKLFQQLDASTPRRSPSKKALDKKTPCLCGTAKCRGFLMV